MLTPLPALLPGRAPRCRVPAREARRELRASVRNCRPPSVLLSILLAGLAAGFAEAAETPATLESSGPARGATIQTFFVRAVTGPHRNRSVCYVCRYGSRPVVMVLIQRVDPDLPKLLKALDEIIDRNRVAGLRSFGVLLSEESSQAVPVLQTLAFDEQIRLPLTAAPPVVAGPHGHNLHPDAATTVVLYQDQRAVRTLAFESGRLDARAVQRVIDSIEQMLAGAAETPRAAATSSE